MHIIQPHYEIIGDINGVQMLKNIEAIARTSYKSMDKITEDSWKRFIPNLLQRKHWGLFEHAIVSVKIICDRGVANELVRHRVASYCQESTRYCNYSQERFDNCIKVIEPEGIKTNPEASQIWQTAIDVAERAYIYLTQSGIAPELARSILPLGLATEIVVTMNLREWHHFFDLRACGTTGKPHPQMLELTVPMLEEFKSKIPYVFDDLMPSYRS